MSDTTIGARIRYWRLRRSGMTQAVLAGLAGVSQSYISQVEAGRKTIERRATLVGIANALQITVNDLLGQPGDPTDPVKAGAADAVPAIWAALIEIEEGERRTPGRSRDALIVDLGSSSALRAQSNYTGMARLLPSLLHDASGYGGPLLAEVAYHASACLRHLGYRHLAASMRSVASRSRTRHPLCPPVPVDVASRTIGRTPCDSGDSAGAPSGPRPRRSWPPRRPTMPTTKPPPGSACSTMRRGTGGTGQRRSTSGRC